jgi:hypothetical protein
VDRAWIAPRSQFGSANMAGSGEIAPWAGSLGVHRWAGRAQDIKWLLAVGLGWLALVLLSIGPPASRNRDAGGPVAMAGNLQPSPRAVPPVPVPLPASDPLPLTAETARIVNAAVPFIPGPISPAKKFHYSGSAMDRERALTCLASAAWYEAGDDKTGEQAVVQVVLNRLRHPAFPKTICGVVFEGASRKTGCQFTFTCDGALSRMPSPDVWQRARAIADRALSGYVFKEVGNATHYHTDWVVPYWSDTLDKLVEVHSHLFYRWRGWWGTAAAFTQRPGGSEDLDQRIAYLADPKLVTAVAANPSSDVVPSQAGNGRQQLVATISPPPPTTVLPMSPATVRQLLPAVGAVGPLPAVDPAANRYWPPPGRLQRRVMSFNQPGEAGSREAAGSAPRP